jgi:hypothetical protein
LFDAVFNSRGSLAAGHCGNVTYGELTAAVSAGVTPVFATGWPGLVPPHTPFEGRCQALSQGLVAAVASRFRNNSGDVS